MANALDLIDAELEKASAPRVVRKPLMLYLSEGQKALLELGDMFNQWNAEKPLRTGYPHASSILVDEGAFCLRQLVLACCLLGGLKRTMGRKSAMVAG